METTALSDEALVTKARQGDRDAFGVLVHRYQAQAILIAQSVLRNFELSKDASQNAFAKAYFGLARFRGEAKFKTWFFRIVLNEAKDIYRKEKARGLFKFWSGRGTEDENVESVLELIPAGGQSPREAFEAQEAKQHLERAIYELPEREREVFILRYLNGLELSEVADTLGIAIGTVKAHLAHGIQKLRSILLAPAGVQSQAGSLQGGGARG
ncbi:MAG: sigma-70 family RNA polymerase sigma factor [Candidatus Omnitrophica bacterium]|nr:sigma-70 family RNA polymerase sigma factor [Candidatus Omnitrophota bacterium]